MKRIAGALAAMLLALTGAQCQPLSVSRAPASQPRYAELPPVPDRLRTFYQELQAGKFEVLADLETPAQAQIFRVEGAGQARLTVRKSRLATGAGALEVKLEEPAASLVVDDQQARDWALPHHWSQYELLLASIYAPAPAVASLQIRSGTEQPATWEAPPPALAAGLEPRPHRPRGCRPAGESGRRAADPPGNQGRYLAVHLPPR